MVLIDDKSRTYAQAKLEDLARCRSIRPFQMGDEDLVCGNDLLPIVGTRGGFIHDQKLIARLREVALENVWPRP